MVEGYRKLDEAVKEKSKFFIDAVGIKGSGAATVLWNILKNIPAEAGRIQWKVFLSPARQRSFTLLSERPDIEYKEVSFNTLSPLGLFLWQQFRLPRLCRQEKADAVMCMGNVGAMKPSVPQIVYFHQSLYFSREHGLSQNPLHKDAMAFKLKNFLAMRGLNAAKFIITQTETVKQAMLASRNLDSSKVVPIHTGVPEPLPASGHPTPGSREIDNVGIMNTLSRPLLLYVAHPAAYKNFEIIIEGMAILEKKNFPGTLMLTLSEPEGYPEAYARLVKKCQDMVADFGIEGSVKFIGAIKPDLIKSFIEKIDIFVFPSLIESFPQVLTEAMACGAVMLLADRPYAREIASNAAIYFDPASPVSFANAVEKICADGTLRQELSKLSLERSKAFDYGSCAKKITSLLISAVEK